MEPQHKVTELPILDALFAEHPARYERLVLGDPHGFERRQAEYLLERCATCTNIVGVEKLATDGGGSIEKFVNLLAEIKFALVFGAVGARVHLLRDAAFAPAAYTPDLHVTFPDGFELLVDVVRIAGGSAPLADALRRALETNQLHYTIEQCVGRRLSVPAFDWSTHKAARELCAKVADTVADALRTVPLGACGVVRIFDSGGSPAFRVDVGSEARENLYDDVSNATAADWLGTFGFVPSPDQRASTGGGVTSAHFIDDQTLGRKFLERVSTKAHKRVGLPVVHAETPFVVAFQSNEPELRPTTVLSTLTGPRQWSTQATPAPIIPRFEHARSLGWEPLLSEWRYLGVSQVRFPNYGAFGDESAPWAKEVSGVVVLHDSDTLLQWLPNPFAVDAIANVRLLDIGFPFDMLGAPSPALGA
jgi:hypothetical protein